MKGDGVVDSGPLPEKYTNLTKLEDPQSNALDLSSN